MERALIEEKTIQHLKLFLEVSEEAKKEKSGRPPISEMIYWWTRKPIIVSRAVTLLSLAPSSVSVETIKQHLHLNSQKRAFKYSPNRADLENAVQRSFDGLKVLDPFAGGGNLMFEPARLGLDCTVVEYNPVAYLILKATFEYPTKYGSKLAEDVKHYGNEVIKRVERELGGFYRRDGRKALHYLWCWCIRCPYCGQRIPLTNNMWLDKKRKIGYKIIPTEDGDFRIQIGILTDKEGSGYTQKGGRAVCIRCRNAISYEQMVKDIAERKDKEMIVVVVKDVKGKNYELPTDRDRKGFDEARKRLSENWDRLLNQNLIPQEEMKEYEIYNVTSYGLKKWSEIFTERQLLLMCTLLKTIKEVCSEISDKEYAKAVATYLGFMLCKHIDYNSIGTRWIADRQLVADTLSFSRPSFCYNFVETNPFEKTSGSLISSLRDVVDAIKFASNNNSRVNVVFGSALHLADLFADRYDIVLTDPPYLDDVPYGEVSEFFYVWLVRLLKEYYPELPDSIPLEEDLVFSEGRFGGSKSLAIKFYKRGMEASFNNIYNVLKDDGLFVVFFAHSSTEAWELFLDILRKTRFRVVSSYAVHTERVENVLAKGKTSFMSSIVLACRKNLVDEEAYFETIMPKVVEKIRMMINGLNADDLLGLPITDLLIMAYGAVLEETTRYSKIKSYRADFKPSFEELIGESRDVILREVVKKLTGVSPSVLGPEASFALIGKLFYRGRMPPDEALKAARAYGLSIDSLIKSGYVEKEKTSGGVRIKPFNEKHIPNDPSEVDRNNIYEQLLYLEKIISQRGVAEAKKVLSHPNFRVGELRSLVSVLLKHYGLLINKAKNKEVKLRDDEEAEHEVLNTLSDILQLQNPSPRGTTTLDSFL
jgi:adenine-specific DNA methylase